MFATKRIGCRGGRYIRLRRTVACLAGFCSATGWAALTGMCVVGVESCGRVDTCCLQARRYLRNYVKQLVDPTQFDGPPKVIFELAKLLTFDQLTAVDPDERFTWDNLYQLFRWAAIDLVDGGKRYNALAGSSSWRLDHTVPLTDSIAAALNLSMDKCDGKSLVCASL